MPAEIDPRIPRIERILGLPNMTLRNTVTTVQSVLICKKEMKKKKYTYQKQRVAHLSKGTRRGRGIKNARNDDPLDSPERRLPGERR